MKFKFTIIFLLCWILSISGLFADQVILSESATKRVLVPQTDIGQTWRARESYTDSDWQSCSGAPGGVGYEMDSGYENLISLDLATQMHESGQNPNTSCYIRIKFSLTQDAFDNIERLNLNMRYDDGFVAYLNGVQVAQANADVAIVWNAAASTTHEADGQDTFNITEHKNNLKIGTNLLAIHGLNANLSSSDFLVNAELVATEDPFTNFTQSNLPLVFIDTNNRTIPNEPKIDANMRIVYHGVGKTHQLDEPANNYNGRIGIETRGSSSQSWPKKQYALETRDENGENLNVSLMGLPPENDWILNAPFIDRSFLRNVLAYDLSRRLGQYASRTRYCELFLNGEYRGVYILMEKIKRDNDRVDIATLDSTDIEGEPLTGGYIIKIDKMDGAETQGFTSKHLPAGNSSRRVYYQYHYPSFVDMLPVQRTYIQNYIDDFEDMMASPHFDDPTRGYPAWIDINSFIDYFLVSEIGKNVDSYRLSTFLYKDRDSNNSRLKIGPVWDYNLAFGLADYYDGEDTDDWMLETLLYLGGGDFQVPFWWEILLDDPAFNYGIKRRWQETRNSVFDLNRMFRFIDAVADTLKDAQARNFTLWPAPGEPGTGFWPMPNIFYSFKDFQDEIDYLKYWIEERVSWMDEHVLLFSNVEQEKKTVLPEFVLLQNFPNPFNPATTIVFELSNLHHVVLEIYNSQGQCVRSLMNGQQKAGLHKILWDGTNERGDPVAGGVYFCRLLIETPDQNVIQTRKMLLIK
ncbi:T9SS C-terminal target domain-containing protein [candidate division KSB1 bacterium]|nr:CotH kinase family protein [candidate division KSB1 bacterium]RQW03042.1 MAG: T9SS C-terminal target domain-containing protein [candidate division KSB1 bacterium]